MQLVSSPATPRESRPVWLQDVMQIFSTPHFVSFAQAVLYRTAGLDIVWPELLIMTISAPCTSPSPMSIQQEAFQL